MQSINPGFIIIFGSIFAALWIWLRKIGRDPSIPMKFGLGIVQLGIGFGLLYHGASRSQEDGSVALIWLVLGYMFNTTGELCLSPVGLSMITKLSPKRITGLMMGTWFLAISFANYGAGLIAQLTQIKGQEGGAAALVNPVDTVMVYGVVFGKIALVAASVGLLMMLVSPLIHRGTHGIK